jgi:HlyD family secretion protein
MDRPLTVQQVQRYRLAQVGKIVLPVCCVAALLTLLPGWIRPTLVRDRIRTAVATTGPIESVITASGTVVPEIERVLSSPLDARVLRILKRPGATLKRGEAVVELDVSQSVLALEKVVKDSKIKDNQQAQARLTLEKTLHELEARIELKMVELQSLQTKLDGQRQLFEGGLASRDALRQAELDVTQARIALAQLEAERRTAQQSTGLQFEGLGLERASLVSEIAEARRTLDLATTKSDREGVLTWVLAQEGALVRRGDVIARIADLTSYRVNAAVSDVHVGHLRVGMPVIVKVNDVDLEGTVAEVLPAVEGGTISFNVSLRDRSHAALRPNLRVDVLVVTDRKPRALRVKRGAFADGSGAHDVFVVRNTRAVRTPIELGLSAFDDVEVTSGLREGDEIVISDMREYLHMKEIALR